MLLTKSEISSHTHAVGAVTGWRQSLVLVFRNGRLESLQQWFLCRSGFSHYFLWYVGIVGVSWQGRSVLLW